MSNFFQLAFDNLVESQIRDILNLEVTQKLLLNFVDLLSCLSRINSNITATHESLLSLDWASLDQLS